MKYFSVFSSSFGSIGRAFCTNTQHTTHKCLGCAFVVFIRSALAGWLTDWLRPLIRAKRAHSKFTHLFSQATSNNIIIIALCCVCWPEAYTLHTYVNACYATFKRYSYSIAISLRWKRFSISYFQAPTAEQKVWSETEVKRKSKTIDRHRSRCRCRYSYSYQCNIKWFRGRLTRTM